MPQQVKYRVIEYAGGWQLETYEHFNGAYYVCMKRVGNLPPSIVNSTGLAETPALASEKLMAEYGSELQDCIHRQARIEAKIERLHEWVSENG